MINNFELLFPYLEYETDDNFYFMQIIKRRKENPEIEKDCRIIDQFFLKENQLQKLQSRIIDICNFNNARAYLNLNKRSFKKVGFETLRKVAELIANNEFQSIKNVYTSMAGTYSSDKNKKWVVDIDNQTFETVNMIIEDLDSIFEQSIVYEKVPTKNGFHLITKPFHTERFQFRKILDIKKDAPTLLYIP